MTSVESNASIYDRIYGSFTGRGIGGSGSSQASSTSSNASTAQNVVQTAFDVKDILSSNASATDKAQATKERVSLAVADYYTGGFASKFAAFAEKHWPGTLEKIRKFDNKFDPVIRIIGSLFGGDKWKTEGNRLSKLISKGVNIPEELQGAMKLSGGRSKDELIDHSLPLDFKGYTAEGKWVNNLFANSRDEKDLAPEDIWGYATFFEKFGNDWLQKYTPDQRREIAQKALDLGIVNEHHGSLDIKWNDEMDAFVKNLSAPVTTAQQDKL